MAIGRSFFYGAGGGLTTGVTLNDVPAAGIVFQRDQGQTSGGPYMTGTYTGTASTLEAQVRLVSNNSIVAAWAPLTSPVLSGGVWSGFGPAVAQTTTFIYKFEIRVANNHALTAAGSNGWGVGIVFPGYGQSNMNGLYATQSGSAPTANAGVLVGTFTPVDSDPSHDIFSTAVPTTPDGIINLLNTLNTNFGVCVMSWPNGAAGADADGLTGYGVTPPSLWTAFSDHIAILGNRLEFIIWMQGEANSDGRFDEQVTLAQLNYLQTNLSAQCNRTPFPFYIESLATFGPSVIAGDPSLFFPYEQRIFIDLGNATFGSNSNFFYTSSNQDSPLGNDDLHMTFVGQANAGLRMGQSISYHNGLVAHPAKWFINTITATNATTTTVTLTHSMGTDFTPTSSITGFEVSGDWGATWVTATGARSNATTVALTHSSIGTNPKRVRYLWGAEPDVSALIKDNSSLAVPLNYTPYYLNSAVTTPVPVTQAFSAPLSPPFGGGTITFVGQIVVANSGDFVVLTLAHNSSAGNPIPSTIVATCDGGSTMTFSKTTSLSNLGSSIWQATAPRNITQGDFTITYPNTAFSTAFIMVYVVDQTHLSSTTANATFAQNFPQLSNTPPAVTGTMTGTVAAGSFVIGVSVTSGSNGSSSASGLTITMTGTDPFAKADFSIINQSGIYWGSFSNAFATSSASYNVQISFANGPATNGDTTTNLVAASWR